MLILCFCSYLTWTGNTASHCSGESAQAAFLKFSDHFLRTILLVSKLSKTYQLDLPTTWSKIPFPSFVPSLVLPIIGSIQTLTECLHRAKLRPEVHTGQAKPMVQVSCPTCMQAKPSLKYLLRFAGFIPLSLTVRLNPRHFS